MSSKTTTTSVKPTVTTPAANTSVGNPTQTTVFNLPTGAASNPAGANGSPVYNLPSGTGGFNYPTPPTGTDPNSPNYLAGQANGAGGSSSSSSSNVPIIVGITVAGVAVLAIAGLLVQRYKARSRTNTINSHQTRSRNKHNQAAGGNGGAAGSGNMSGGEEERGDRAKLAKSFTIRKPPSVYVDDDQDLDQTGHPRYKSASDAQNHPYYGDHRTPGLVEYELSDTSGQKFGPSSVAERKRYVEQQQRKVMDEYEMFNPHKDPPPQSPYPPSLNSAPSYTSRPLSPAVHHGATSPTPMMTPSMGGRSPRVHHPTHQPFGRNLDQQMDNDYKY
ncbi:hypothetical protein K457DRAFT_22096 [Linnemannia elongata AG-77]|uniref:Uncharacterized protein n=1 Tax=Linnemannia elongata AG-77 TaxID=1314771 RepID=A0A197JN90_9FUNG|nr:hypothetical protein K457DRAFT_22096 [Linnemannia elongata AG-77]